MAVNCCVAAGAMVAMLGESAMDERVGVGVPELEPEPPVVPACDFEPHPALRMRRVAKRQDEARRTLGEA